MQSRRCPVTVIRRGWACKRLMFKVMFKVGMGREWGWLLDMMCDGWPGSQDAKRWIVWDTLVKIVCHRPILSFA